jgi:MFS family permease
MSTSLHLTGTRYEWLLTAFYIAYIVFEWFALMWKIIPAHVWAACTVLAWYVATPVNKSRTRLIGHPHIQMLTQRTRGCRGLVATLQSTTTTFAGEMVCRFLLGMAEAGFGPGVPFLLSFFYLRRELGFRIGLFLAAAPLANSFAGGLAYVS